MQQLLEPVLGVRGDITLSIVDAVTGELVRRMEIRNLIVTQGLTLIGNLLQGYGVLANTVHLGEIQVGKGTTAAATGNTAIETPTTTPQHLAVVTTVSTVSNQVEVKCTATLLGTSVNGETISEAALCTLDSAGANPLVFARQVYPGVPMTNALNIVYDWRITFTA
jgi:hypothetical protein